MTRGLYLLSSSPCGEVLERCRYTGTNLLDDARNLVAWSERQRSLKVRIAAATNHGIGKAGAGGEYLDANLPRGRFGDSRLLRHLQDFGTAEPRDAEVLPRHLPSIDAWSVHVEHHGIVRRSDHRKPPAWSLLPVAASGGHG